MENFGLAGLVYKVSFGCKENARNYLLARISDALGA